VARQAGRNGRKRVTIADVAERAGVSVPTVSRVLAGNYPVAQPTRTKVQRAIRELDYVANAHARALAGATTKTVAFVVHDIVSPFFAHIAQGVEEQARQEGRTCLVSTTHGDPATELAVVELMRAQHADAVILVGGGSELDENRRRMIRIAKALDEAGSRLVLCGRPSLGDDVPATVVEYDNEGGAFALASHLLSLGHRRIAFLGYEETFTTSVERLRGFQRAHEAFNVEIDYGLVRAGQFARSHGYDATCDLLREGADVTAIFATTDTVAAGALQALREQGVQVPSDMSVVGYDDIPLAAEVVPALTTVHIPHEEMGRTAVRLALHRNDGSVQQHVLLGTHIVVRESVAPVPRP
jgi:LacI family transcriptional regulator